MCDLHIYSHVMGAFDCAGTPVVTIDNNKIESWTFGPNNVLAWQDEAGYNAWLQFVRLPNGPIFTGNLHGPSEATPESECLASVQPVSAEGSNCHVFPVTPDCRASHAC